MKHKGFILFIVLVLMPLLVSSNTKTELQDDINALKQQTIALQTQLDKLQHQLATQSEKKTKVLKRHKATQFKKAKKQPNSAGKKTSRTLHSKNTPLPVSKKIEPQLQSQAQAMTMGYHSSTVSIHAPEIDPESVEFYPTALVADDHVLTYIAGTPVVSSPYLGSRPAFDGSDYIVNISSINRDIRLMQQRRSLDRAYAKIGYPIPNRPILALSGKAEPIGTLGQPYFGEAKGDWNLGSSELDVAAILNDKVEAYLGLAYDSSPPAVGGQRVSNSSLGLNMGFVNIGDLDESPFYFTAGQLFVPFGRYSTAMVSAPLPMRLARVKARPVILGYKAPTNTGIFAALYAFRGDTTEGSSGVSGFNLGYIIDVYRMTGEVGFSIISSINDSSGMQFTGSVPGTTFGGFGSVTNGSEAVYKVPALGTHCTFSYDRYNITAEWVATMGSFREQDLSFNGRGASPQALQLEAGATFMAFDRPSSLTMDYQWSKDALALNIPQQRISGVFNISIWKDTVESLEYRHDLDYGANQFANGASAPGQQPNQNTVGTGGAADTVLVQIGVYF